MLCRHCAVVLCWNSWLSSKWVTGSRVVLVLSCTLSRQNFNRVTFTWVVHLQKKLDFPPVSECLGNMTRTQLLWNANGSCVQDIIVSSTMMTLSDLEGCLIYNKQPWYWYQYSTAVASRCCCYLLIKYRYRIDIAIFWQYRIDIISNSKNQYRCITSCCYWGALHVLFLHRIYFACLLGKGKGP